MRRCRASIPQHVRETLGENIQRERVIRKMTQAELGEKIGTSQMMVSRFEKGVIQQASEPFSFKNLLWLCEYNFLVGASCARDL